MVINTNEKAKISLTVNGNDYNKEVEPRRLLSDFIRHDIGLTGTHVGCEHGACGMCTIIVDGETVRSCLMFAIQADGANIETVEGLGNQENLHPVQKAFMTEHGLQCGYCTPAMLMTTKELLDENPNPDTEEIREAISSNLCRCTGYESIVNSVERAAEELHADSTTGGNHQ